MRLALDRMIAALPESTPVCIQYEISNSEYQKPFYARIGSAADDYYALGNNLDEVVDQALAKYGTVESRRVAEIEKLKLAAAKLGCTIDANPSPKKGAAQ